MTSLAWPNEMEWYLWYTGDEEKAIAMYLEDPWRKCKDWDGGLPDRTWVRDIFLKGKTSMIHRGKTPWQRYLEKRYERILISVLESKTPIKMGCW